MSDPTNPVAGPTPHSPEELYEEAPVGYLSTDPAGAVLRANRTLLAWTGLRPEELLRQRWSTVLLTSASRTFLETHVAPLLRIQGAARGVAFDLVGRGGARLPVLATITERKDDRGAVCERWFTFIEAVDREHYERELLNAKHQAEQAAYEVRTLAAELERRVEERTAELSRANRELDSFTQAVSHDLRSPLRAMRGFSALLLEEYAERLDERGAAMLASIDKAARNMTALIEGLLHLSSTSRAPMCVADCDVSQMVEHLRKELQQQDPERQVEWRIQPDARVQADARMLEAALRNLLGNAWKYTSKAPQPRISFECEVGATSATLRIADNGVGFDMDRAERLFEPFRRLHAANEFPGLGIGLATVRRIVERHGGEVAVHAAPGQGATFRITLPAMP